MREKYVEVTDHNAGAFELAKVRPIELSAPVKMQRLLVGLSTAAMKSYPKTQLAIGSHESGRGFTVQRTDNEPIQGHIIGKDKSDLNLPPFGVPIFYEPVDIVPVYHDIEAGEWEIQVPESNVVDAEDLNTFVFAIANNVNLKHYRMAKAAKEAAKSSERPLISA